MDWIDIANQALSRAPNGFDVLFEHLPETYFFVKDADRRFVRANRAFIQLVKATKEADVVGRRDDDFFPPVLAENYARDDSAVLSSGQPIVEKAELVQRADGTTDWFCTTKLPLLDAAQRPIGICGVTRSVKRISINGVRRIAWDGVLETLLSDYARPLDVSTLAKRVGLSPSQLTRQFRRRFQVTPRAYLTNVRMEAACHWLVTTDVPVAEIAERTGFYDSSHFVNQFAKRYGISPAKFRNRHLSST